MRFTSKSHTSHGFTLIEMMVIAPIVILAIGSFIALLVNLTGEIMSSRGSNITTYNIQSALDRIENDVKLSSGFLYQNTIPVSATNPQGRTTGSDTTSTANFVATGHTDGPALILNTIVTDGNPLSLDSRFIYKSNSPNSCASAAEYTKNTPMTQNTVYFLRKKNTTDENYTLYRRVIMPVDYATASTYCGSKAPWQQPSCTTSSAHAFCKTNDEELVSNIPLADFTLSYFTAAGISAPVAPTSNATLQAATTINVGLTSHLEIAGRDVVSSGQLRVSRLDSHASALGNITTPTTAPVSPNVSYAITDGHKVTFSWPRVPGATSYTLNYTVNGTSYESYTRDNNNRSVTITRGWNGDTVVASVTANNSVNPSPAATSTALIPVWTPLVLNNSWTDYANGYGTPAFTRTKTGMVLFKGLVKHPTYSSGSSVIATIPGDYAPRAGILLFGVTSGNAASRIDVNTATGTAPNTTATVLIAGYYSGWVSLNSIRYDIPETRSDVLSPYGRTTPALLNSWVRFDTNYANASYAQDPTSKRVFTQGLVKSGTLTDGTAMFALPTGIAPQYNQQLATRSTAFASVAAGTTSFTTKGNGTNTFLSVNGHFYPNGSVTWTNVSLVNSWVNHPSFAPAGYVRTTNETNADSQGVVSLRGVVRNGTTVGDTAIFTLPQTHCPTSRLLFSITSNNDHGRLDVLPVIAPATTCEVRFMTGSNVSYSLDGISFLADRP